MDTFHATLTQPALCGLWKRTTQWAMVRISSDRRWLEFTTDSHSLTMTKRLDITKHFATLTTGAKSIRLCSHGGKFVIDIEPYGNIITVTKLIEMIRFGSIGAITGRIQPNLEHNGY